MDWLECVNHQEKQGVQIIEDLYEVIRIHFNVDELTGGYKLFFSEMEVYKLIGGTNH